MSLPIKSVENIAHLARISIKEQDMPVYAHQLSDILNLVDQMSGVDTSKITPMAHPLDAVARLRADVVLEGDQRDLFQSIAPQVDAGLYLVPKVIE